MPVARPSVIPFVCNWLKDKTIKDIQSVLDVGSGFGIWGFLTRQYIQIWQPGITREQYENWKDNMRVDSIEYVDFYNTNLQKVIYNNLYVGDVMQWMPKLGWYDLIIMGDLLEHLPKEDGKKLLGYARERCRWLIILTPNYFSKGNAIMGNESEQHQCVWKKEDFSDNPNIAIIESQQIIIYENNNYADEKRRFQQSK